MNAFVFPPPSWRGERRGRTEERSDALRDGSVVDGDGALGAPRDDLDEEDRHGRVKDGFKDRIGSYEDSTVCVCAQKNQLEEERRERQAERTV